MKIYTVITYFSNSEEINFNYVKSFKTFIDAENYFNSLSFRAEIITNYLLQVKLLITLGAWRGSRKVNKDASVQDRKQQTQNRL